VNTFWPLRGQRASVIFRHSTHHPFKVIRAPSPSPGSAPFRTLPWRTGGVRFGFQISPVSRHVPLLPFADLSFCSAGDGVWYYIFRGVLHVLAFFRDAPLPVLFPLPKPPTFPARPLSFSLKFENPALFPPFTQSYMLHPYRCASVKKIGEASPHFSGDGRLVILN